MSYNMYVPTRTLFGAGQLNNLHAQNMPGKKAMIVISNGKSTRSNGYLARTEEQLKLAGVETVVFDKVEANPLKSTVMTGGAFAKENNCDFILALGGGSCMDAAKAIAVMATNDGDYWDYVFGGTGKGKPLEHKPLPIITITTTAGTGSETDPWAVITHEENHEKIGYGADDLFPVLAIVDPELMLTVPPKFTAYQGFDALFHNVEGYVSNGVNLMSDMYAITAIENIAKNLAKTVKNGNDLDAREKVAFGNTLAGTVMCVGACTSQHSLEHAMSAYHQELPHGAGLIMISKAYFSHLIDKHVCDDRFVQMAKAMGMEDAKEPMDFIKMLVKLQKDCGVADLKMSDYGIKPEEFETMAKNAKDTMGFLFTCDRTELSIDDCVAIYKASFK
ncbi:MAG: alcohol dehydrogenase [Methanolobus sp.]|jgi:alcohol dehydrogenase|uniref:iron-containing alcohol dehydrogenase n=1 Tax=Methanolobus sp. TaxID=1874737 RepID=UPI0025896D2E|nr:iron-containing alcohol dehydrogenase [Methanolobus sp.]MDK2830469.1 alcohol dehydrogenase [Methanolobus sp.]MDK2939171.1 alcohol dehydrogenase [Methanolobus sp.]